ncbi:conserved hypothetical protein [Cupriavidus necator]|uniref:Uncharacterized protein n=1 Tax=Cupriavidus necator TaxID=106590 RepID=A0A1K0J428_CUPNE|nr:conserved hypothetical protein [Cupriavidus necator]
MLGLVQALYVALVRMFEQSLKMIATLPETQRPALWARLAEVRRTSDNFGYGGADDMNELLGEYGVDG